MKSWLARLLETFDLEIVLSGSVGCSCGGRGCHTSLLALITNPE